MWDAAIPTPGRLKFAFASSTLNGTTAGGTMFALTFKVIGMPENGTTAVTLSAPETGAAVNGVDFDITPTLENAAVTVSALRGDVDLDGQVDADDALAVFYHVNRKHSLSDYALHIADENGDGTVNLFDAVRIFYLANELPVI